MHVPKKSKLFRTFSFRLALHHMLLMALALFVTLTAVLFIAQSFLNDSATQQLLNIVAQGEIAYLDNKVPTDSVQLPEALLNRVESAYPGLRIGLIEEEIQPGGGVYEVIGSTGKEWMEIMIDSTGETWVANQKTIEDVYDLVVKSLQREGIWKVELFILSNTGKIRAGLPSESRLRRAQSFISKQEFESSKASVQRGEEVWLGATVLFDGNYLIATYQPREATHLASRGIIYILLVMGIFLPLSGGIGYYVSHKAMRGVQRVSEAARRIQSGHFTERVTEGNEGIEIEDLALTFNEMINRIEILIRELRDVTVNIAHDMRTPITRIRSLLEMASWDKTTPAERQTALSSALEECDAIAPLIDSILELAAVETGQLALHGESINLVDEVHHAYALFSSLAEDRNITFSYTVPDGEVEFWGDRSKLQRIIANLVDNAIKYTPDNGTVCIRLESDTREICLTIQDNGIGIAEEDLSRVYERFYRAEKSRSSRGNGLGLSMVKALVQALRGTVHIESQLGAGCSVYVHLPHSSSKSA